jgi:hypothetical protein
MDSRAGSHRAKTEQYFMAGDYVRCVIPEAWLEENKVHLVHKVGEVEGGNSTLFVFTSNNRYDFFYQDRFVLVDQYNNLIDDPYGLLEKEST